MSDGSWYTKQNENGSWSILHTDGKQAVRRPDNDWKPAEFPTQAEARNMLSAFGYGDGGEPVAPAEAPPREPGEAEASGRVEQDSVVGQVGP